MIQREEVIKLAELSLLNLTDEEITAYQKDFTSILDYVSELTTLSALVEEPKEGEVFNVMREDANPHESGVYTEALLKELPQREGDYVKVKKILNNQ